MLATLIDYYKIDSSPDDKTFFRKEEERIRDLNSRYGPEPPTLKPSPQRHKPPRSDPTTRLAQGRETEISNYTDNNRRGRRSRSQTPERSRSPEVPSHTSPVDTSPKGPMGIPRRHMTLAEKKRQEWERDRGNKLVCLL